MIFNSYMTEINKLKLHKNRRGSYNQITDKVTFTSLEELQFLINRFLMKKAHNMPILNTKSYKKIPFLECHENHFSDSKVGLHVPG